MDYHQYFQDRLNDIKEEGRYRIFAELERQRGQFPTANYYPETEEPAVEGITVWCSNDYLGMGQNPRVIEAMKEALDKCGAGAGGTRNIAGTNHYHALLEAELASLHNKESSLLFTSGYVANMTTLMTLGHGIENCILYSDALNHNSMIEASAIQPRAQACLET